MSSSSSLPPCPPSSSGSLDDGLPPDSFADVLRQVARADPVRPEDLAAVAARHDLAGRSVGPFRVLERLGAGGMGVVYAALDAWLGRRVALKVLAPRVPCQAGEDRTRREVRLLLREARAAAAITHPNVAAVYAAGEADGIAYIAMEYVDGATLRARLAQGRLPLGDALRYARQIASGVAKAHERGVVHGDLKPDNVMIDCDDRIKILDFGLARPAPDPAADPAEPPSQRGGAGGTPAYMAPEQALDGRGVDARSDVFALGVLFYEMLTSTPPFPPRGADRTTWTFVPRQPLGDLRPETPAGMRVIVDRCLLAEPVARYASAGEVVHRMDATLGGPPSTPRYPSR